MSRLVIETERKITQAGYSTTEPSQSDGEHLTRYGGGFHATCVDDHMCCRGRNGALIGKNDEGMEGFTTIDELLDFLARTFPEHNGHKTRFIVPGLMIDG